SLTRAVRKCGWKVGGLVELHLLEGEVLAAPAHGHGVTLRELAAQDLLGQLVLDEPLDGALERARAVLRIPAVLDEELLGRLRDVEREAAPREPLLEAAELDVDDALHLVAGQPAEDQDVVEPVEELRAEVLAHLLQHRAPHQLVLLGGIEALALLD